MTPARETVAGEALRRGRGRVRSGSRGRVAGYEVRRHVGAEHGDAVVVGEREDLVVVHDGVEVLDPDGLVRGRVRV
eukprot:scaffold74033_cov21-Phaeocystis_antarctica.AAC.1